MGRLVWAKSDNLLWPSDGIYGYFYLFGYCSSGIYFDFIRFVVYLEFHPTTSTNNGYIISINKSYWNITCEP